jgi:hypothetical protein
MSEGPVPVIFLIEVPLEAALELKASQIAQVQTSAGLSLLIPLASSHM